MTKPQLDAWIASARWHDGTVDFDSSSNRWEQRIYEKDGRHYSIEFCNKEPFQKRGPKGYIKGDYEVPKEVRAETRTIVKTDWIPAEEKP